MLSGELKRRGIEHVVLNAKPEHAEREGETIAQAGRKGAVTIATNMAGRGVDIKLGGNPEQMAHHELLNAGHQARRRGLRGGAGDEQTAELEPQTEAEAEEVQRARRPLHLRHRAPRVAPDRQPASRPLRPPGRPRRVALLPLRRGRPDPPLRRRPHLQDPRPPRPGQRGGRGGAARGEDADPHRRERPEEGRGAELPDPQARARVRRRHERAAPRSSTSTGARSSRARTCPTPPATELAEHRRAHGRRVHPRRRLRGLGPRRARDPGAASSGRSRSTSPT